MSLLWLLLCVCVCSCSVAGEAPLIDGNEETEPTTVSLSGVFRGSWLTTRRGRRIQAYRGIRYARSPTGTLRFQPPRPILHYDGEVDAREDGPACPMPGNVKFMDEDCLRINVYTPNNNNTARLPVIFFIHPGGFYEFSGRSVVFGPNYLLDRDVVLVTINYRLGSLGFLSLGIKEAPGNIGFKDQVAGLKWVQRNIASFGGDPSLVTIAGCSAGGISVIGHLISPMSTGLFHRAISMSGSPTSKVPSPTNRLDLGVKQAQISNCPTTSPKDIFDCLLTKTWQELASNMSGFREFGTDPLTLWRTTVEPDFGQERFLPVEPIDAIRAGPLNSVPTIITQTRDEFFWKAFAVLESSILLEKMDRDWDQIAPISFVLPRENATSQVRALRRAYLGHKHLKNDTNTADGLGKLYGDGITAFPVHRLANLMCQHSKHPVWYYEFSYIGNHSFYENATTRKPIGVAHQDDLLYLFPLSYRFPSIPADDSEDSKLVDNMIDIWYNFAIFGDPNPVVGVYWESMRAESRRYLRLAANFTVQERLKEERFTLWDTLYPIQY